MPAEEPPADAGEGLPDARVELQWNPYDTGLFTQKLYRHVVRDDVAFDLEATSGSLLTSFAIHVPTGHTVDLIAELGRYLLKRKGLATDEHREVTSTRVVVLVDGIEYDVDVEDEEDVAELRRLAMRKGEGQQATFADF